MRFVDDESASGLVPKSLEIGFILQVLELRHGQGRCVYFLDEERVGHVLSNQPGNRGLARAGLPRQPECSTGHGAALGQRLDAPDYLFLSDDIGPSGRPILFGQCFSDFSPPFQRVFSAFSKLVSLVTRQLETKINSN